MICISHRTGKILIHQHRVSHSIYSAIWWNTSLDCYTHHSTKIPTIVHRAKLQLPVHPALFSSFLEILECQVIILQNKMSNGKKAQKTDKLGNTGTHSL